MPSKFRRWWNQQRSSARLAYILHMMTRVASALLSLLWTPLLISAMGRTLYGTFLTFQSVATLGALGDLGMGGAVQIETNRLLGREDQPGLVRFLAAARTAFFAIAIFVAIVFCVTAPWLPSWLKFEAPHSAGSLPLLFIAGGLGAGLLIAGSYITNLNVGALNLTWPIIPTFLFVQLSLCAHWLFAATGAPLWLQYLPYVAASALILVCAWNFIRRSHPHLASALALGFHAATIREILAKSFWVYMYCIGASLYIVTDRLVINAGFGAPQVPSYHLNFKLCELALFVIASAGLVSMPKIATWIASADPQMRARGARETQRLSRFQAFFGCAAVLVYVAVNDAFMRLWVGDEYRVPLSLQSAFAANMGVTAAGYAAYESAARCGPTGLRFGAMTVVVAILFKILGSYWAMSERSILGVASSTVISQSIVVLASAWFASKTIRVSWWRLAGNGWLIALISVGVATLWKSSPWWNGIFGKAGYCAMAIILLGITAKLLGLDAAEVQAEWHAIRSIFRPAGSTKLAR
jgi:O-antigen/teichoic acid export membrane protein